VVDGSLENWGFSEAIVGFWPLVDSGGRSMCVSLVTSIGRLYLLHLSWTIWLGFLLFRRGLWDLRNWSGVLNRGQRRSRRLPTPPLSSADWMYGILFLLLRPHTRLLSTLFTPYPCTYSRPARFLKRSRYECKYCPHDLIPECNAAIIRKCARGHCL